MLNKIFISVLNMSLISSYVIIFVLVARIFLKKTPKIFSYVLWGIVLFRLICPFSFESVFSLVPMQKSLIPQSANYITTPQINTDIANFDNIEHSMISLPNNIGDSVNPIQIWIFICAALWILGMFMMTVYSLISFIKLNRSLVGAIPFKANIYLVDHIPSPFVMGLFKPKIYLPSLLTDNEKEFIIVHEMCHITRLDHITRIAGFIALTIHWFNPLVWAAFILSAKDMEMSCDETVMKKINTDIRAEYSQSLLRFKTEEKMIHAIPLTFSEGDTKTRIKNVLNYKKPTFWVVIATIIAVTIFGIGLMVNPKAKIEAEKYIYYIMTEEVGAIGCEYGVNINNELDTLQMLENPKTMNGFKFDEAWAEQGYIKFVFQNDIKPKQVFLRYYSDVDDIWQQEYPIDSADYKIKVPHKTGTYNFFANIVWENGKSETAYFSITVNNSVTSIALTKETADEFINKTLSTFRLNSDNTISFTLPMIIPTDESGKTQLYISSSARFSPEPGIDSNQNILDWKDGWLNGETYTQKLEISRGKLTQLFLRVAFMTAEGENSYREYATNYIEFTEPFKYNTSVSVVDRNVEISQTSTSSILKYTMQNGKLFSIAFTLPKGLTLLKDENSQSAFMPEIMITKNDKPIGSLTLYDFGTDDKDVLTQIDTSENTLPMPIFSPIALSNHTQIENYKVLASSSTGANATAEYLWQDLTDYGGNAPEAPWLKSDCILVYDYEKIPFLIYMNLVDGTLSSTELENLAKSIIITN